MCEENVEICGLDKRLFSYPCPCLANHALVKKLKDSNQLWKKWFSEFFAAFFVRDETSELAMKKK